MLLRGIIYLDCTTYQTAYCANFNHSFPSLFLEWFHFFKCHYASVLLEIDFVSVFTYNKFCQRFYLKLICILQLSLSFTERRNWSFSFFKNSVKMPNNFLRWKAATRYGKICSTCGLSSKTDANQNFILNARMLNSSDFPYFNWIHQRRDNMILVWLDEWQKSSTFSLPYDEEKDCLGRSKTHQSCDFSPPVSFSSSSLWQLSPPCLPHTLPCQKCSSSIHPPFLSQCNVNVGGWRCDALIILQKVFRCGRQSRLMKQSWRWDRLWSEVEIQSFNNWS